MAASAATLWPAAMLSCAVEKECWASCASSHFCAFDAAFGASVAADWPTENAAMQRRNFAFAYGATLSAKASNRIAVA